MRMIGFAIKTRMALIKGIVSFNGQLNKPGNYEGINMTAFNKAWDVVKRTWGDEKKPRLCPKCGEECTSTNRYSGKREDVRHQTDSCPSCDWSDSYITWQRM